MAIIIPKLPITVDENIQDAYILLRESDVVMSNFETSALYTITGTTGSSESYAANVNRTSESLGESVCAFTASVTGSLSGQYNSIGMVMMSRGVSNSYTANVAGTVTDIGVVSLRKRFFDGGIQKGSLTATATGTNAAALGGDDISGDYYDSGSGQLIQRSTGNTVGSILYDDGLFVLTATPYREVAVSLTSLKYRTKLDQTNISVFCKCGPDELNKSLNHTVFATGSLSSVETQQSYNNLYVSLPLSGSTSGSVYDTQLSASGFDFSPYITHVGLYNDDYELMALAKMTKPLKKPTDIPITFQVSIDI